MAYNGATEELDRLFQAGFSRIGIIIILPCINPEQNRHRFYWSIAVQDGLFGNFYLIRHWGRIDKKDAPSARDLIRWKRWKIR